jgi:S-methylmethionine-dependent homocysteine/selenocysteine methylase
MTAGCDVITTNSFVAVPPRMIECDLASDENGANSRAMHLIIAAVDRAKSARTKYCETCGSEHKCVKIAGCIPPITECYFAEKVLSAETLIPMYKSIIAILHECDVDILLAETLSTLREAKAILQALSSLQSTKQHVKLPPLWMSFTIHDDQPTQLRSGELLEDACQFILNETDVLGISIEAIGVNCSAPSAIIVALKILKTKLENTEIKCMCYGNCFQTTTSEWIRSVNNDSSDSAAVAPAASVNQSCRDEYDVNGCLLPGAYAGYANAWAKAGATIIGGCCGCSPSHMKAVASALRG